jgi:hypothetical protein
MRGSAVQADQSLSSNDPPVLWEQKQTIVNMVIFCEDDGKPLHEGCRIHLAPCEDGRWFAWAEAHIPPDDPEPCDAFYDFYDGTGRAFRSRAAAVAAIYRYTAKCCLEEAESVEAEPDTVALQ